MISIRSFHQFQRQKQPSMSLISKQMAFEQARSNPAASLSVLELVDRSDFPPTPKNSIESAKIEQSNSTCTSGWSRLGKGLPTTVRHSPLVRTLARSLLIICLLITNVSGQPLCPMIANTNGQPSADGTTCTCLNEAITFWNATVDMCLVDCSLINNSISTSALVNCSCQPGYTWVSLPTPACLSDCPEGYPEDSGSCQCPNGQQWDTTRGDCINNGLTLAQKIGIGVGVSLGAMILIAAGISIAIMRFTSPASRPVEASEGIKSTTALQTPPLPLSVSDTNQSIVRRPKVVNFEIYQGAYVGTSKQTLTHL